MKAQPTGYVQVGMVSGDPSVATVDWGTGSDDFLIFTAENWGTEQVLTVKGVDRALTLQAGTATLTLIATGGGYGQGVSGTTAEKEVSVTNTTEPEILVSDAGQALEISEDGDGTFTVALKAQPTGDVQVSVVSGDTSVATVDWGTGPDEFLTFTAENWGTEQVVTVKGVDRASTLQAGTATLTLTATGGGYGQGDSATTAGKDVSLTNTTEPEILVSDAGQVLEIAENGDGTFRVALTAQPTGDVQVSVVSGDTSVATVDWGSGPNEFLTFTTENWGTEQVLTVKGVDRASTLQAGTATLTLTATGGGYGQGDSATTAEKEVSLTNATTPEIVVSNAEDVLEFKEDEGGFFTVALKAQPTADVQVSVVSRDPSVATVDWGERSNQYLKFTTENWDTEIFVIVSGVDRSSTLQAGTATFALTATGGGYGQGDSATTAEKDVRVTNTTEPEILVSDAGEALEIAEDGDGTFTVALKAQPTGDVQVSVVSGDPSVATVDWGTGPDEFLTFTAENWETEQSVTVKGVDRASTLQAGTATLTLTATGGGYTQGNSATTAEKAVSVTNTTEPEILVSDAGQVLEIGEDGDGSFRVALKAQPTEDVQVSVVSGDPSVATVDWGTGSDEFLTFTAENWGTEQVVTVKGVYRASILQAGRATLTLTATGGGYGQGDSATTAQKDVSVTTPPDAPTDLLATPDDEQALNLTWTAPSDGGSEILYYEYEVNDGGYVSTNSSATNVSFKVENGVAYQVRVRAVNDFGAGQVSETVTVPYVTLTTDATDVVSGAFTVEVAFSEPATCFDLGQVGDIVVENGTVDNFTPLGLICNEDYKANYSFDVTPTTDGPVKVDVPVAVALSEDGHSNTAALTLERTADVTGPSLALNSEAESLVSGAFTVTATFSEAVTGFDADDVDVDNGSVDNFQGSGSDFSFDVTPEGDGDVTVDVAAGAAVDSAGNGNAAATQLSRTADVTAPTVTLQTSAPEPIGGTFSVTAQFSEDVSDFALDDLILTNAVGTNLVGSGSVYSFNVTPAATGTVTIAVAEEGVQDRAGNGNEASAQLSVTADLTSPTVSLATSATSPVGTTFSVSATFSEDVTDFDSSDVEVANGSVGNFQGSGQNYSFDVTPISNGEVTVDVGAGVAQDVAGNGNAAATPLSLTADLDGPTLGLSTTASNPVAGEFTVTATFSESVTGFELNDIVVGNGTADNFQGTGSDYSFDVTPASDGDVTVDVAAGVAFDSAGNGNAAAAQLSWTADMTAPTVALTTLADGPFSSAFSVTATFSEPVTGFGLEDLVVGNATFGNFLGSGSIYTFDVTPTSDGDVTVDVVANVAFDSAGNGNAAAAQLLREADLTAPTVGLANLVSGDLVGEAFTVTATFSEAVTGFELSDVEVGNGIADNLQGTGSDYSFDVRPTSDGDVTVSLGAGVAFDSAGNGNLAASTLRVTADLTASTVTLDTQAGDFVSGAFTVTATFDEAVTGFELNDVVVTNASLDQFAGSGASYSFDVTPTSDGLVTVDVAAGAAQDGAGNATTAAAQLTRTADLTVPTVTLQTSIFEPIGGTFSVTAEFSENVSDFALDDLILTNAVGTNLVGSGSVYSFNVTPAATGTVTIAIAEEGVQDRAGNGNQASDQLSVAADLTSPTVSLATSATSPVGTTFSVSATFSEDVTDFDSSDVEVDNGSVGNFSGSGRNYSFDVTPQGNGDVKVDVGAGVAQDAAGNGNAAAASLVMTADLDGSTLGLSTTASNPVAGEFTVTATFSESVTGFELNDIVVGNGTADNFQGTGSDYSFDVTPTSDGDVTVDVAAGVAFDSAGNGNAAAAQLSRTADIVCLISCIGRL